MHTIFLDGVIPESNFELLYIQSNFAITLKSLWVTLR